MNVRKALTKQDRWLAAEYALGVLNHVQMQKAEQRMDNDRAFRAEVEGWDNQLSPMLDDVPEMRPPSSVWKAVESATAPPSPVIATSDGGLGFWKMMTAFASTAAVGCFALMMYTTGGDFTGSETDTLRQELASVRQQVASVRQQVEAKEAELAQGKSEVASLQDQVSNLRSSGKATAQALVESREALSNAEAQTASVASELESSRLELAQVRDQINKSVPLVASLTQSGNAPAFVAQYDPLKQALLIRTTVSDTDEKVPEIWLIPDQGDRKGEVLSLGVMDESAPDTVQISDDFLPLIGEGGTLAITMEPPGGAPNGVATGPVIALGKLQAL